MSSQNTPEHVIHPCNCSQSIGASRTSVKGPSSRYHPYIGACPHEAINAHRPSPLSRNPTNMASNAAFSGRDDTYNQHINRDSAFNHLSLNPDAFPQHQYRPSRASPRISSPNGIHLGHSRADNASSTLPDNALCPLRLTGDKRRNFLGLSEDNKLLVLRAGNDEQAQLAMLIWVQSIPVGKDGMAGPIIKSKKKPKKAQDGELLFGCRICGFPNRSMGHEEIMNHVTSSHPEWRVGYPCIFAGCPSAIPPFCQGPHDLCIHLNLFHGIKIEHEPSEVSFCSSALSVFDPAKPQDFRVVPPPPATSPDPCTARHLAEHHRAVKYYGGDENNQEYVMSWIHSFYIKFGRLPMHIIFVPTLKKDGTERKKQAVALVGCVICGEPGQDVEEIMPHIISNHIGTAGFRCKACPKSFFRLGDLKRHIREDHADERTTVTDSQPSGSDTSVKIDDSWTGLVNWDH